MRTVNCPVCAGTGLRMPLCDAPCPTCKDGQVELETRTEEPKDEFPRTADGGLVKKLNDLENLSNWEIGFCNKVTNQVVDLKLPLSPGQRVKLKEILKERS